MYQSKTGELEVSRDGRVALVRLVRPAHRNALSAAVMEDLRDCGLALQRISDLSAVVLTGTEQFFSAGADLRDRGLADRLRLPLHERLEHLKLGPDMCRAWEEIEAVTIAAIEGYCIGGGMALALACDFRVVGRGGHLRLPEIQLGINMSWQSLPRLVALVGPARAKEITIFCERIEAETAFAWGLADRLVDDGAALATAMARAHAAAAMPPIPARMSKTAINRIALALAQSTIYMDREQYALAMMSEDRHEAVSAYLGKRTPSFKGE